MKILLAPNSFKNSLSSVEIVQILSDELSKIDEIKIIKAPLSDGGDGFLEVIKFYKSKDCIEKKFETEFANEKIIVPVLVNKTSREIFLESAEIIGLKKTPQNKRNPLTLNSFAVGDIISKILISQDDDFNGIKKIIIGVGGTATIDFGLGTLNALGFKFFDIDDNEINPIPVNFSIIKRIKKIQSSNQSINQSINLPRIYCVVDVDTKLLGEINAIEMYGYQKGANKNDIELIKKGIKNILNILKNEGYVFNELELNGAGGGLAAGLKIFLDAEIIYAKNFITSEFLQEIESEGIDYVITAEGKFDIQSFEGKVTGEIIKKFHERVKKIFLICGCAEKESLNLLPNNVEVIQLTNFFNSVVDSLKNSDLGLKIAVKKMLQQL